MTKTTTTARIFTSDDTSQLDDACEPAQPGAYYFEPDDYEGDVLWSAPYRTWRAAADAASLEGLTVETDPTTTAQTRYTTRGDVRGSCGHRHGSIATAHACLERDARGCQRAGAGCYSDRRVVAVEGEGEERDLDDVEAGELECLLGRGW